AAEIVLYFASKLHNKLNGFSCSASLLITTWAVLGAAHILWDVCLLAPVLHKAHSLASGESSEGVVFGVLSGRDHFMQRLAVRDTWASDLDQMSGYLPSKIAFVVGQEDCHIHPKLRISSHSCQSVQNKGTYAAKWYSTSPPISRDSEEKGTVLITGLSFIALTDVFIASLLVRRFSAVTVQFESGQAEFSGETLRDVNGLVYFEIKINRFVRAKEVVEILVHKLIGELPLPLHNEQCQWSNGSSSVKYEYVKLQDGSTQLWADDLCVPFIIKFENGKTQCPSKWTLYEGHCYVMHDEVLSWEMAVNSCKELNAMLPSIADEEENIFLAKEWSVYSSMWIGLSAPASSRTFSWIDGSAGNYSNWDDYEPNNNLGSERCVELNKGSGLWNDYQCSTRLPFVCKKPRVSAADLEPELSLKTQEQLQQQWLERLKTIGEKVAVEQRLYGDLLIVPGLIDTHDTTPHKLLALLQWTASTYPGHWLFKADDDILVNVRRVLALLGDNGSQLRSNRNCGIVVSHFKQLLKENHHVQTGFSPLLPFSPGYLLSDEVVSGLATVAPQLSIYESEAISLAVWLSALTFPCTESPVAVWDTILDRMLLTARSTISAFSTILEELFLARVPISKAAHMASTAASLGSPSTASPAALISEPCWHRTQYTSCHHDFIVAANLSLDELDKLYKTYFS
ncbi:C-type lectin-like, partial [Trinorchestia longiramus]